MTDQHFDELIAAYLDGKIASEDLRELHRIVCDSPAHRKRFQDDSRLHVLMREAFAEQVEISALQTTVDTGAITPHRKRMRRVLMSAAACLILGLSLWGIWSRFVPAAQEIGTCLFVSGSGQATIERGEQAVVAAASTPLHRGDRMTCAADTQAMLRLNDGTIIYLEPGCQLRLMSPDQTAPVNLEQGEALFEIAEQVPAAPFEVVTPHAATTVLGTTFTLEASESKTLLKVYEGTVQFTRTEDGAKVKVQSEEMVDSNTPLLAVSALTTPAPLRPVNMLILLPTDAASLDRGTRVLRPLKVEGQRRTCYLRFDVPSVGVLLHAKLRLTQTIDPGSGTLTFATGSHSHWLESTLDAENAPQAVEPSVQRAGVVQRRETIEVDVSPLIRQPGPVTIVIDLDQIGGHDIWFHSRKSDLPPRLILTYVPTQPR